MYMMYLSGCTMGNVKFLDQMSAEGRIELDFSHTAGALSETQKIALEQRFRDHINHDLLGLEITSLDDVWIKSHHYTNQFDAITTDILVDSQSLPFVMSANVAKTDTIKYQRFHPLAARLQDSEIKIKLAWYNVGKDCLDTQVSSARHITVSDVISGWDQLRQHLLGVDIPVDPSCLTFYQHWIENNRRYFPSTDYVDMVKNHDYDWKRSNMSTVERYALLVLSQGKFRILHDEKQ